MSAMPIVFGEVLYDIFPDGSEIPGGAPFNVAWHLHKFGCRPLFISRIGRDGRGDKILRLLSDSGMTTEGIQIDDDLSTGEVRVVLEDGQPTFDIVPDRAFDHISWEPIERLLTSVSPGISCYGTLACRSLRSRRSFIEFLRKSACPGFMDINIRDPWWNRMLAFDLISSSTWLKLNADEVRRLDIGDGSLPQTPREMLRRFDLESVIVTDGAEGAFLIDADGTCTRERAVPLTGLVDTVGAGDALSAIMIVGLMRGWPSITSLGRAVRFAADICGIQGAIPRDDGIYDACRKSWGEE